MRVNLDTKTEKADLAARTGEEANSEEQPSFTPSIHSYHDEATPPYSLIDDGNQSPSYSLPIREQEQASAAQPPVYSKDNSVKVTISPRQPSQNQNQPSPSSNWSGFKAPFMAIDKAIRPRPGPLVAPLCDAVTLGDASNVAGLVAQGADVNGANGDGKLPLGLAIEHNQPHIAQILLMAGANPNKSSSRRTPPPLFTAAIMGSFETADALIDHGAEARAADITGSPYVLKVVASGNVQGVKYLLDHGANASAKDLTGEAAIVMAVKRENLEMAALLLKHGAKATAKDITGQPVLAIAIEKKNMEIATLLLDNGADPNSKDLTGSSVLAIACHKYHKRPQMTDMLLAYGANPNSKTVIGTTVFSDAVTSHHLDLARRLLEHGANANATEVTGQPILITVITDAAISQADKAAMVQSMLDHGVVPEKAKDFIFGEKAIDIARKAGNGEIVALLEKYRGKRKN